jgi:hypothetical protein
VGPGPPLRPPRGVRPPGGAQLGPFAGPAPSCRGSGSCPLFSATAAAR